MYLAHPNWHCSDQLTGTSKIFILSTGAQSCLVMSRLLRGEVGWSEGGMATLEVNRNERLIEFLGKKVFLSCIT